MNHLSSPYPYIIYILLSIAGVIVIWLIRRKPPVTLEYHDFLKKLEEEMSVTITLKRTSSSHRIYRIKILEGKHAKQVYFVWRLLDLSPLYEGKNFRVGSDPIGLVPLKNRILQY